METILPTSFDTNIKLDNGSIDFEYKSRSGLHSKNKKIKSNDDGTNNEITCDIEKEIVENAEKKCQNDKNITPIQNLSLCIPDIHFSVTKKVLNKVFQKLNLGQIDKIDMLEKVKGKPKKNSHHDKEKNKKKCIYNKIAFIHFKSWIDNERTRGIQDTLMKEEHFNVVYKMEENKMYFFKCLINKKSQ